MPGWLARPGRRDAVGDDRAGAAAGGAAYHLPVRGGKRGRYIFLAGGRQRADGPRRMVTVPVLAPFLPRCGERLRGARGGGILGAAERGGGRVGRGRLGGDRGGVRLRGRDVGADL